jgi:hypothetical protein
VRLQRHIYDRLKRLFFIPYSWILKGQCSETFVCRIDDVKCLRVSISMNELLQLNVNKFGEKFITYTNQIYRLISKLRRVCRITTHDLHRWDNSQTDEIRRNDDKYWYFLMIFFVDRCNLSYLNFHVNMLSMASLWNCKAESHLWFTNPWYIFLTNKSH